MIVFSFGDIVLLKFPFTDGAKQKKRPALVIRDTEDNDIIVCRITSEFYRTKFDFEINHWQECGLKLPSIVRLHKIATLNKTLVERKIGSLNKELEKKLQANFKMLTI